MTILIPVEKAIDKFLKREADAAVLSRGRAYFIDGCVEGHFVKPNGAIDLYVSGSYLYTVSIIIEPDAKDFIYELECGCPYGGWGICKHAVAALLWLQDNPEVINQMAEGIVNDTNARPLQSKSSSVMPGRPKKHAKPTKPSRPKLHHAGEPYTINDFPQLSRLRHKNENQSQQNGWIGFHALDLEFVGDGEFKAGLMFKRNTYGSPFALALGLKIEGQDMHISCSCGQKVSHLCAHAFIMVDELIKNNAFGNLQIPDEKSWDELGQRGLELYGFNKDGDWRKYFKTDFAELNWKLEFQEPFRGLIAGEYLNQYKYLETPEGENTAVLAPSRYGNSAEPFELGYAIGFGADEDDVFVEAVVARKDKKGASMQLGFSDYARAIYSKHILKTSLDRNLLALCETLLANDRYDLESIDDLTAHFETHASALEQHPYIYFNKNPHNRNVRKGDLCPIRYVGSPPLFTYHLQEKDEIIRVRIKFDEQGASIALSDDEIDLVHPLFLKTNKTLYFLGNQKESEQIQQAMALDNKSVLKDQFPALFDNYLKHEFKNHSVNLDKMKSYKLTEHTPPVLSKELYLSEIGNFVLFKPFLRYGENMLLNVLTENASWELEGTKFSKNAPDDNLIKEFKDVLGEINPAFAKQVWTDYLHLSYSELMHDNAFLDMFSAFSEKNIKVFGLRELKGLKISPYPAKAVYQVKSNIDWFDVELKMVWGDMELGIDQLKKHFVPGSKYIELGNGSRGLIPEAWLKKLERLFRHGQVKDGKFEISKKKFSLIDELFDNLEDTATAAFIQDKKQKLLQFNAQEHRHLPKGIKAKLRHYQIDGFQWLNFLDDFQWGGILADDMGLGKTLQIIVFLKHILKKSKKTNLVVVPTSLLFNWENEIKKFAPSLKTHFYYGADRIKSTEGFDKHQIILTSYGHMLSDIALLKDYKFNYVILDESQAIKNPGSKRYKAARLLQANNRLAMTGTPIENNTFDLYAQMSFLNPGLLGSAKSFKEDFAKAIDTHRDAEKAAELQRLIRPFVLRRTKEQVATELPDKTEEVLYCEMEKGQQKVYDAHRNEYRAMLLETIDAEGESKMRFQVLAGLTKLRQICDSPQLLPGDDKYDGKSVKIDLLMMHIKEKTAKHKILVFSQFVGMLRLIEQRIESEGIPYAYLDGQSSSKQRQESVEHFQGDEDCRVFLISLKAGGTGLNLMAADYVYIVDPWWNPAVENQAIDRCYRIGQDKKVIAYRMICKNTVEEKIMELQQKKKAIAGEIISTDEGVLKKLGKEEILGLFA